MGIVKYSDNVHIFQDIGYGLIAGFGITAGAHRLWAHRSYSAKTPLRIFLATLYCMAGQVSRLRSRHSRRENRLHRSELCPFATRRTSTNGYGTIELIISTLSHLQIPTTPTVGFSSPTWVGWWSGDTQPWKNTVAKLIWAISSRIR